VRVPKKNAVYAFTERTFTAELRVLGARGMLRRELGPLPEGVKPGRGRSTMQYRYSAGARGLKDCNVVGGH
jgi:hypothetical protein